MHIIDTFNLKDGRQVSIVLPSMDGAQALTDFVNRLSKEDTFLSFAGEKYSLAHEKNWLENALAEIKFHKNYILWAEYDGQIVGNCDIKRGPSSRDSHVGTVGLMIDKDFRGQGLGKYLLKKILEHAKKMNYKIAKLDVFSDNEIAIKLYKKMGFKEYSRLPNGFFRKGKYSDKVEMYKEI